MGFGPYHAESPPDPRLVDPVKAGQLRDLFRDSGWSGDGADLTVMGALFCARVNGRRVAVPTWGKSQDTDRLRRPVGPARFYVATAFVSIEPYTRSLDAVVRLLGNVLPGFGYALTHRRDSRPEACLVYDETCGCRHSARSAPLALLAALFDELAAYPEAAASRRCP